MASYRCVGCDYVYDEIKGAVYPWRDNIIKGLKWLVRDAEPGDHLFFQYSGHGTRIKDESGDEEDGFDTGLVPLDAGEKALAPVFEVGRSMILSREP